MNQCANCQWWKRDDEDYDYYYREGFGVCELAAGGEEPKHENTKAYAQDWEGYRAWLHTRHDFGCNQWELKADEVVLVNEPESKLKGVLKRFVYGHR